MRQFVYVSVVLGIVASPLMGQARPATNPSKPNAAGIYLQAFKRIPPGADEIVTAAAKAATINWLTPIEDKHLASILQNADPAIVLLHDAAAIRRCDWTEVFAATQPAATQPADMSEAANELYQNETWNLVVLGGAKAAALFDQKHPDEGARCACDAMNLCVRAPRSSGLLLKMIAPKFWESLNYLLADHLTELSPSALKTLQQTLHEMPRVSLSDDLRRELRDLPLRTQSTTVPTTQDAQAAEFIRELSKSADLPAGKFIVRMNDALKNYPRILEVHLA